MKSREGKDAQITHIQFSVTGPLLSLEEMKGAYVFHVWDTIGCRNMTATAELLQVERATSRRVVSVGIGILRPREEETEEKIAAKISEVAKEVAADVQIEKKLTETECCTRRAIALAAKTKTLWDIVDCPECWAHMPWRVRMPNWGTQEIYCINCGYISTTDKEDAKECPTTPTSSPSP